MWCCNDGKGQLWIFLFIFDNCQLNERRLNESKFYVRFKKKINVSDSKSLMVGGYLELGYSYPVT